MIPFTHDIQFCFRFRKNKIFLKLTTTRNYHSAVTLACHSDSVPFSGQKVYCVLPCYGVCGYVCPREGLLCKGCKYVENVEVIAVRRIV